VLSYFGQKKAYHNLIQSEIIAKHKVIQFFRLADQGQKDHEYKNLYREFCWVLLPELTLFRLSEKSHPSEILTSLETTETHSSTFLTGITDMVWLSLTSKKGDSIILEESRLTRKRIARELLENCGLNSLKKEGI